MRRFLTFAFVAGLSMAAFSSCSNDTTLAGGSCTTGCNLTFIQIDRVGKPNPYLLFVPYADGTTIAATGTPVVDTGTASTNLRQLVNTFVTGFAGRSAAIANYLSGTNSSGPIFAPDVIEADMAQSGDAEYLGVETLGAINTPVGCFSRSGSGLFGGRGLIDDTFQTDLNLVFGNGVVTATAGSSSPIPDDGKEQNGSGGTPNLTNDNVGCTDKQFNFNSFPYLGSPR